MWPGEIQKNTSNIFAFNTFDDTVIWLSAHRPLRNPTINWMSLVHCDPFLETPVHSGRNWFSHMDVLSLFSQSPFHVGGTISLPKNRHVKASYSWRWNHIGPALGDPLIWQGSPAGGILKSKQLLLCWNPKDHCCRLLPFWLWKDPFEFKFSLPRRTKTTKAKPLSRKLSTNVVTVIKHFSCLYRISSKCSAVFNKALSGLWELAVGHLRKGFSGYQYIATTHIWSILELQLTWVRLPSKKKAPKIQRICKEASTAVLLNLCPSFRTQFLKVSTDWDLRLSSNRSIQCNFTQRKMFRLAAVFAWKYRPKQSFPCFVCHGCACTPCLVSGCWT